MRTEKTWTTWYGQTMKLEDLSHGHLSNILHFFKLIFNDDVPPIRAELERRFGGIQLPYHPMISFRAEIKALVRKGYTSGEPDADIIVDGKWIGNITYNRTA